MAAIVDTLRNPDKSLFSGGVVIVPVDAPTFNGDAELYGTGPIQTEIFSGVINQPIEPGRYRFHLGESRPILIQIPNDSDNYTLAEVTISATVNVASFVASEILVPARDMRFMLSVIQGGEVLAVPARRQHLTHGSLTIEPGGTLSVADGGAAIIL